MTTDPGVPRMVLVTDEGRSHPSTVLRLLLWDFSRGSLAYDLAFFVAIALLLLVPAGFWGDPLCPR